MPLKLITVVGARPQFIKAAPLSYAIGQCCDIEEILVHTGQHFDVNMSEVFFRELDIPTPRYNLGIAGASHGAMTGRMLEALEAVMLKEQPDGVLVYGDTNSTLAGALSAAKLNLPIAHVEAGLRSFNRKMPEEINRIVTDHLSSILLCPTQTAVHNLKREGLQRGVHHVGDVMYDASLLALQCARASSDVLDRLGLEPETFSLATIHRAENTDNREQLAKVLDYLKAAARELPVVLPIHPRTRKLCNIFGLDLKGLITSEPVGYLDMARLLDACVSVFTDSGGLQKEAYFHRKPCVTLRTETEWIETIDYGWNRLWTEPNYRPRRSIPDFGEGLAAARIVPLLCQMRIQS